MNTQIAPTFASRGGHDDKLSTVHIPDPRNRAQEPLSPADRLRLAEGQARDATARAEAAEAEGARNRVAAQEAAQEAKRQARDLERQEERWREQAERQVMALEAALRKLTSGKVGPPTVSPADRAWARTYLHGLSAGEDGGLTAIAQLRQADEHLAGLFGLHQAAGHGLTIAQQHAGDEILERLDRAECACYRQILRRVRAIAGEEDWS